VHADTLEDDLVGNVDWDGRARYAEEGNAARVLDEAKAQVYGRGMTGHLQCGIDALAVRMVLNDLRIGFLRIECQGGAELAGKPQAILAHIRGDDRAGARGPGHGDRKKTGWPASRDQDRMSRNVFGKNGMDGITQGLLHAGQLRRDLISRFPQHLLWQAHI